MSVAAVMGLVGSTGCSEDDGPPEVSVSTVPAAPSTSANETTTTTTTTTAETTSPDVTGAEGTGPDGTSPDGTEGTEVADPVPEGTNFGYLRGVDAGGRTVTIDIAELLTGDAAVTAAIEDGAIAGDETSVPNDVYVRNRNPKLRTVAVAPSAPVNLLTETGGADLVPGSLQLLSDRLIAGAALADGVPVQVVVVDGTVTRVDEVYFP